MSTISRPGLRRFFFILVSTALLAGMTGCMLLSAGAKILEPPIEAQYKLAETPLLIVVDDPQRVLGTPDVARRLAGAISYELTQNSAAKNIIPQEKLISAANAAGDDFMKIPLDKLGRSLGAKQVLNINIEKGAILGQPGILRPTLEVRVRVVDADTGARLFPDDKGGNNDDPLRAVRGLSIVSTLDYKSAGDDPRQDILKATDKVIVRSARDVGRLFYDYISDQPGDMMREDH